MPDVYIKIEHIVGTPAPMLPNLVEILGDEELSAEEMNGASRTAPINDWPSFRHHCTPSVVRFYKAPREQQGDFRVDISTMLPDYLALNGEEKITDPITRYFFGETTAIFNTNGYPMQMYVTMQGNKLKVLWRDDNWVKFETLTIRSDVTGMTYESHPWFIQRFDLVCWKREEGTYHKPSTPQGTIYYFLVTAEGFAYIPARYVRDV